MGSPALGATRALRRSPAPRARPRPGGAGELVRQRAQLLDELGRLAYVEVDPQHRDAHGEPAEVVVACPQLARALVERLDRAPAGRYAARDLVRGRVQRDERLVPVRRGGDALLDVGSRVLRGEPARRDARAAVRRPTAIAIASSSSSSSGGIAVPARSRYPPAGPVIDSTG